ncbi:MAG: GWxTD domain-containing protein [candidate division Zixibacteria bacterium]|nr:GWxTD domain-containing protein [candidate division Zixibacteria bacterium]
MLYRDTLHVNFTGETVRQLREISLEYFSPGEYELEMSLRGRRNKKLQDATFNFQVLWTLEGVVRHDWKTTLRQLAIIAEPGELDGMKDLEGIEERRDAFRNFWLERDPTPGTEENEALDEFYRRIHIANHHFAAMLRDGWTTDRGRIFIEYGSPDQIDDVPFSTEARPYQIWHYYTTARYLRFLFIDENEDGEYRLQYPYDGLNQQPDF